MAWSAASARALLAASPIASVEPTAIAERITEWLKITVVPLCVLLIGACILGCIKYIAASKVLTEDGGGSTRNEALGEVRPDSPRAISNNEAAEDNLETGLELSQVRCRDEESDTIPYLCVSALIFGSVCFTVGGVATGSVRKFFELWFVFCDHAACITFFGIFLAMMTTYAQVATVFIFIVVNH